MKGIKVLIMFFLAINIFAIKSEEVLLKTKELTDYESMVSTSTMVINKDGEDVSNMKSINYVKKVEGDDYQLVKYTEPSRLKGTAILVKGDTWYYNKRTNRLRLLSASAKEGSMMGSSFSYDDLSLDYIKDFDSELLEEGKKVYRIKLVPKDKKKFKYLIVEIGKESYLEEKIYYYNHDEIIYKKMEISEYYQVEDKWVALQISMDSILEGKKTIVTTDRDSIDITTKLDDKLFSERELKK